MTLLVWLENVKAMSKKSTEVAVVVSPGNQSLIIWIAAQSLVRMSKNQKQVLCLEDISHDHKKELIIFGKKET